MERRFAARREQLLADAEVDPRIRRRPVSPGAAAPRPVRRIAAARLETRPACPDLCRRPALPTGVQERRVHRLPPPGPGALKATTAVHRPVALGRPTLARRVGSPSGPTAEQPRQSSSSTPRPSPRKAPRRWACSGSGAADSANSTTARSASTSATSPAATMPWSISASSCPRIGPRPRSSVPRRGIPKGVRLSAARRELALEMLDQRWPGSAPHAWFSGDDEIRPLLVVPPRVAVAAGALPLAVPSRTRRCADLIAPDPP